MSAYNGLDQALLGLKADNNPVTRVETRAAQEDIEFGYPVYGYLGDSEKAYDYHLDTAKIVFDADLVTSNSIVITVDGDAWDAVVFDTDHDTTMDLLVAEGQGEGYEVALDATDANNRTLYIKKSTPGTDVGTVTEAITGGASQATGTITYQSDQVFLGVSLYIAKDISTANSAKYAQYESVSYMSIGILWAIVDGTVQSEDDAYVDSSGADVNKFSATAGLTVNAKFRSDNVTDATSADKMAKVEVKGPVKVNAEIAW